MRTRYCYLVEKLPADIVEEVMDLLENVPDDNPYDRLKEAILKRTGASNEAMLRNLFTQVELEDRTPSQLLRHMRTLLGDNKMSENIMRSLWLDKLPTTTQILAPMTEETQTEKLADIADRIHESFRSRRVNSIQPQPAQQRDREFNDLKSTVERLSIQLQGLLQKKTDSTAAINVQATESEVSAEAGLTTAIEKMKFVTTTKKVWS
ncbi:unnamed protein product [Acanthosepion pharaonis]|uniref:DUF7041 domain-containing protein n=1 Tax=Acanthosepion pharaonis TaxID=158019 RepID=A0A812D1R4_ACAPH|nr:unnamed protein product [Sepia pharaonis]